MEIHELAKPVGQWCPHRTGATGCAIYGSHPQSCRDFACQWILEPDMPHRYRPDRTKVVLAADNYNRLVAHCDPMNALAWRREPMYSLLKRQAEATWMSGMTVAAKAGDRIWIITPTRDVDLGELDPRQPMNIIQNADGTVDVEFFPPVPEGMVEAEYVAQLMAERGLKQP